MAARLLPEPENVKCVICTDGVVYPKVRNLNEHTSKAHPMVWLVGYQGGVRYGHR